MKHYLQYFFLILTTEFQASLFTTFAHKIVCLDSTHKTNQYRFKLLTLVVPDKFRNGNACISLVWCDTIQACRILSISQASHYNAIMGEDGNSLLTILDVEVHNYDLHGARAG